MQDCRALPNVPAYGMATSRIASAHPEKAAFENNGCGRERIRRMASVSRSGLPPKPIRRVFDTWFGR